MSTLSAKFGYVIEANVPGFFYNRVGQWTHYGSAAEGYVWSEDEVVAIREKALRAKSPWPLELELAHPAVYDDSLGITVVTGSAVPVSSLIGHSNPAGEPNNLVVPDSGGKKFDVQIAASKLGVNMIGGAMHSL